jgi:hypothetical protein
MYFGDWTNPVNDDQHRLNLKTWSIERKYDYEELRLMKVQLHHNIQARSEYIEFFAEVAEINYGRQAHAIYDGRMLSDSMRHARIQYDRGDSLEAMLDTFLGSTYKTLFTNNLPSTRRLEHPDIYTLQRMQLAYRGIRQNRHTRSLPQDIWNKHILPLLFRQQTIDNFNERCKVARNLKKAEDALRNFRLGYADYYAEERRQHKFLYDVYKHFMRKLHSKHDKLEEKVKRRLARV